ELESDPIPYRDFDVAKLKGADDAYRVRIGDTRLVYVVDWRSNCITITRIEPRERAYEGLS
ncbi:MAG: type II toxin-antitoxin system RelE/ParE family toxin, partial [Candidatus Bathyarchaeota archaeon]|nr:type II toxin-antitoxin system RelE/ParE family toxin [Candidatus Bathyarchaeota archaeon]